ncbi:Krr1 family protein [Coccidioides posadasii C735 delta SOWgp]|uniref:Krr1 family protein n=1 Tax=Coccidioides posadasii (strain C735) TaxID=222929 RepID=C5P937_COCP7|nr:Krr1 family protein [Coccidioides posadasii C735 delta SOWgp]EER26249.1 Krr1 family protein [Coccidioides posadasii C735 delta SOWgp]|eukprot:XP_003068394.1 Krr1 family protein [Coccidioides posadasii C735 delta SOWgp]
MELEPPTKKQKKLLLSDSSDDESADEGVNLPGGESFKINAEYARRFEHNKKREELQKLEEKLGKSNAFGKKQRSTKEEDESGESEESSESETEDDEAELVTEAVDSEILATIKAIRTKDPRVYDENAVFYTALDTENAPARQKEEKPMYLRDYHRENLLRGANGTDNEADAPKTYVEEQEELKRTVVKEMHAAVDGDAEPSGEENSDGDDGFLVRKSKPETESTGRKPITEEDVAAADKDPDTFLSNFMASRAWIPSARSNLQPLESDDDEEEARAEAFEEAYNLRFEDPNKLNEALVTHARDTTSKFSVRREEPSGRKRKREVERLKKEEEKKQRDEERARLRKLKIEELEEQVEKIKKAAGIRAGDIRDEDWARFLDDDKWDDKKWEEEMAKRFGEEYYAEEDPGDDDDNGEGKSKKQRLKKPTWDDDIDIKDIVPDFEDEDEEAEFGPSDADEAEGQKSSKKKQLQDKKKKQKEAKRERRKIEQIVDQNLNLEPALLPGSSKKFSGTFRYRETSPLSFGLTARDILMADDSQLNQFAGLKKLAAFRPPEKKQRDQKKLGKKARLRQWRKDTFGDENEPQMRIAEPEAEASNKAAADAEMSVDIRVGEKKKRKRSKKH